MDTGDETQVSSQRQIVEGPLRAKIELILEEETGKLQSWFETSGYPHAALKDCYGGVNCVRSTILRLTRQEANVELPLLIKALDDDRFQSLQLYHDEFGLVSSTYRDVVNSIRALDTSPRKIEQPKAALPEPEPPPVPVQLAANGRIMALAFKDHLEVWDTLESVLLEEHAYSTAKIRWTSNGQTLLRENGETVTLDSKTLELLPTSRPESPKTVQRMELYYRHGSINLGSLKDKNGKIYKLVPHPDKEYKSVIPLTNVESWQRAGKSFIAEHDDSSPPPKISRMTLWNLETGELTRAWDYSTRLDGYKLCPNGEWLACIEAKELQILDCSNGKTVNEFDKFRDVVLANWSVDGKELYSVQGSGDISALSAPGFRARTVIECRKRPRSTV